MTAEPAWILGFIGGSGLYALEGLDGAQWIDIETPWGKPSDSILCAELYGIKLRFLPRHGRGHRLAPSDINYRANIDALKRAGCTDILSFSAVGSLQSAYGPGDFIFIDQYVDRTFKRENSFFGQGVVAHISMAEPVCARLSELTAQIARPLVTQMGGQIHHSGTYLAMEGPQFSSKAESHLYRTWGCDVIGMTNMPEARLAREAELPYASVCMVTDYDCWHPQYGAVDVASVLEVMQTNADLAAQIIKALVAQLAKQPRTPSPQEIERVLDVALVTDKAMWPNYTLTRLEAIMARILRELDET